MDIEKKPNSKAKRKEGFFHFLEGNSLLANSYGTEAPLLKHTLNIRMKEGHFSCLWSMTSSQACPQSVIGGLQRVAKTRLLLLSAQSKWKTRRQWLKAGADNELSDRP